MKKRFLSISLMLCLVFSMLPGTTVKAAGVVRDVRSYEELWVQLSNTEEGDTIRLMDNIDIDPTFYDPDSEETCLTTQGGTSFTLDLNGHTLSDSLNKNVLVHSGTGQLTITDSVGGGKITGRGSEGSIKANNTTNGPLRLMGGTVEATDGTAINVYTGLLYIQGGRVTIKGRDQAMNVTPYLEGYGYYQWRTSSDGVFLPSTTTEYSWYSSQTYIEIQPYTLPVSSTPTATATTVNKSSAMQAIVYFTLTNYPAYVNDQSWKVYTSQNGGTEVSGVAATNAGNTLSLIHSTDVPAATYYVSVTENGKSESSRLALTVGNYVKPITYYNVWVGEVQVTSENMTNVLGDGKVSCTVDTKTNEYTLTLTGANITGAYTSGAYKSGIYADGKLNIVLADGTNNTVTGTANPDNVSCGIYATSGLSFYGDGSLTVSGGAAASSYGIYAEPLYYGLSGGIYFGGTGAITAQGGEAGTVSYGIYARDYILVLNGTVTAKSISTSGTAQAIKPSPSNLSSNYKITAGANEISAVMIDSTTLSTNINTYKYLKLTPPPVTVPTATTEDATGISKTTATLNGTVNANNSSTTVRFEYGTSASYGSSVIANESPVIGDNIPVSYALTGLAPGTTYHYRVVAVNSAGTAIGSDKTFTTTLAAPTVTAGNISISGGSGTGGAYKTGDTVTATWNNTASGDNNSGITSVKMNFSQFGGSTAVTASNSGDTWTATYTIGAGSIDATNRNVSVTAINAGGTTTTAGTTNAVVDNILPTVTDDNISINGGSGAGGTFKPGDTVTATWNNTVSGDNNTDTISSVAVNFSAFGGSAAVTATNSSGIWTAAYTITALNSSGVNKNVSVTVTDNAGNTTTRADSSNATVNTAPDPVSNLNLTGKLIAPVKNAAPSTIFADDDQYSGTVTWSGSPTKFLGGTAYTATVTLTARTGYTFIGVDANSLSCSGATVAHAAGSGNILTATIVFTTTAARVLQSIAITTPPTKTVYQYGDTFNRTGMVVKANYDDGTVDTSFNAYGVDKTNPLTMDDTTVTLTATANSGITTTQSITVSKADGPDVPTTLIGVAPTSAGGTDGKITGTTVLMEYADNTGFTGAKDCAATETIGLSAGNYYVRMKATTTHEAGAYRIVYVPAGATKIAVPTANTGLKWTGSEQTGVNSGTGYTLSGTDKATSVGNYTATATLQPGYSWNDNTTAPKTISWSIAKADGPAVIGVSAVGCTTADNNDGKLMGVTIAMEYKKSGDLYYTTVTGSAITVSGSAIVGLTSGDYLVRVAETDTHNAGAASTFTVASFIPAPTYTISGTITGSDTNSGIGDAVVQLKSGGGNIGSSVITDSSGAYIISDVPAGTYTIVVSADGYDSGTISSFDVSSADIIGKDLILNKTVTFIPVTDITLSNTVSVQVGTNLTLTGTITPANATNRTITWSVENANSTGAIIIGNNFRATSAGTVTVKATVINGSSASSDYNETFTITITAVPAPIPNPDPVPSNTEKPEGKVEKNKQQEDGTPAVNVNNSSDELKISVLTPGEQEMVAKGENAKIILKVTDISTSVSEEEKKLIQDKLSVENKAAENGASDIPVLYVDLSLYKQVGSQEQTKVTETKGKISISLEVPEKLWNTDETKNRAFYVVRIHNGEVTRIDGSYDPVTHLFTFETDRFSTYALTYQDMNTTTDQNNAGISDPLTIVQDFNHLRLTAKAYKTSQKLSYAKVAGADGYFIFGAKCGQEMKKLADVEGTVTEYTVKKLQQATYYKYQVMAYKVIDGEKVIFKTSKVVHSITEGKSFSNPTKVTSDTASVKLAAGESKTVTCQVVLPKGKKLKEHTAVIRYESTNKEIATVNSKGKITAKAKGNCYVYAYSQNGVYKKIKITVK